MRRRDFVTLLGGVSAACQRHRRFEQSKQAPNQAALDDIDVSKPVRHPSLTLGEAEELLGTWKLPGLQGG